MAIDPKSKTLREYKQYYYQKVILVLLSANACVILGLAITLHFTGMSISQLNFWIIILVTAILQIISSISIVKIITAPLNKILAALSHKIGELTPILRPDPTINVTKKLDLRPPFRQFTATISQKKSLHPQII